MYDRDARKFILSSVHPGHALAEIEDHTGFEFGVSASLSETLAPSPGDLKLLRGDVSAQLRDIYPEFASRLHGPN